MRQIDKATAKITTTCAVALVLAACSGVEDDGYGAADTAMAESAGAAPDAAGEEPVPQGLSALESRPEIPVTVPKMAYVYDYGFSVPGAEIAALQLRHADMCEAMGPYSCQIVGMDHSGHGEDAASGRLQLAVAADKARAFLGEVTATLEGVDGEQVRANITGEDLSKQLVDTEARLRSRVMLRDRLLDVLRTRQGDVSELVEAERSVARINEEIDQARSWMEEMRGRVAFSRVNLAYESATPVASDMLGPVQSVIGSLGSIFGMLLAIVVLLLSIGVPLGLLALGWRTAMRRFRPQEPAEA